jgi:hypothetical protein
VRPIYLATDLYLKDLLKQPPSRDREKKIIQILLIQASLLGGW